MAKTENQKKDILGNSFAETVGSIASPAVKDYVDTKINQVHILLLTVVVVLLVMVATLVVDSFHFNSATYIEYSEKINMLNTLNDSNAKLLDQNNQNQELILQQQSHILEFLKNK